MYNPFHAVFILRSMPIYLRFVLLLNTEMSKRLSNFKVERSFRTLITRGQSFTIFYNKNFYPLLKWDLMYNIENRTEIHLILSNLVVILDVPWSLWYKTHLSGHKITDHSNCSKHIFTPDLTPGFNRLRQDNYKTKRETVKLWDLVPLILVV